MGNKKTEDSLTFAKLKCIETYKEWVREIRFALQNASLESYVDSICKNLKFYTNSKNILVAPVMSLSEEKIKK